MSNSQQTRWNGWNEKAQDCHFITATTTLLNPLPVFILILYNHTKAYALLLKNYAPSQPPILLFVLFPFLIRRVYIQVRAIILKASQTLIISPIKWVKCSVVLTVLSITRSDIQTCTLVISFCLIIINSSIACMDHTQEEFDSGRLVFTNSYSKWIYFLMSSFFSFFKALLVAGHFGEDSRTVIISLALSSRWQRVRIVVF